jgi:adenine deaminase
LNTHEKKKLIDCALGKTEPDFVLKNAIIADVFTETLYPGDIAILGGRIAGVGSYSATRETDCSGRVVAPGFIDAHMHLESSMTSPSLLAPVLLARGTTAVIADPHEIANVCGLEGVRWLMRDSAKTPLDVFFALPSCVPLDESDHNGAVFSAADMKVLRGGPRVSGLGEVMNPDAVLAGDDGLLEKIELMQNGTIDGHAPGVSGRRLQAYRAAGVQTDHECSTWEEALERLRAGFFVQVREGSAAKNLEPIIGGALRDGVSLDRLVFCTDDVHLDDASANGHIDRNIRMAVALGVKPVTAIKMATLNAARAYGLRGRGAVAPGCLADLVVLDDLDTVSVREVYKGGIPLEELPKTFAELRPGGG